MKPSFFSSNRGSVSIFTAVGITVAIAITGVAIDMSRYTAAKSQFRNAVDQAVLAAASSGKKGLVRNDYALRFFNANMPAQYSGMVEVSNFNVTFNPNTYVWTGTADGRIETTLSKLTSIGAMNLSHKATVKWDEITTEIVFAVDMSASMCATFEPSSRANGVLRVQPDPKCTKLKAVKHALDYIIGGDAYTGAPTWYGLPTITTRDGRPAYKVGIVPFNHKVRFPNVENVPDVLTRNEPDPNYFKVFNSDPGAAETAAFPLTTITPLVSLNVPLARSQLLTGANNIRTRHDVPGWTRSNLGLLTASLMLDPAYTQHFGGATPADFGDRYTEKVVFLLTDGSNVGCCFSDHPTGTYENQYLYSYRSDNDHMDGGPEVGNGGLCATLKERGYTVYTMVYDVEDTDAQGGGARIKQVMKNCATSDTYYYDLDLEDGVRIKDAYKEIAKSLVRVRLVE